jgi:uncharacterized protein (TIGR00730 family)
MAAVRRLCVYCGSSLGVAEIYRTAAARLGSLIGEAGIELVYGGGRVGLMGVVADAALAAGGRVTGVIPGHLHDREVGHTGISEMIVVSSMHERKRRMFDLSDGFITLPGGLGTLDETFEIITWKLLGLHDKPIVIVDLAGYWAPLRRLIEHTIAQGFTGAAALGFFHTVAQIEAVLPTLRALPEPALPPKSRLV